MSGNSNLHRAKKAKQDEFYTQLADIQAELQHYKPHFRGKVVYCNCDDHDKSQFPKYFIDNFEELGLKLLVTTSYNNGGAGKYMIYNQNNVMCGELEGDGDFSSEECIDLLKEVDIVVTNPPFSLFRKFVAQLVEYDKEFLIIGSLGVVTYKDIFKLIKHNKLWMGINNGAKTYNTPHDKEPQKKMGNTCWYTNLYTTNHKLPLTLTKTYKGNESHYPVYDNYNAIEVSKVADIPYDYTGVMGVPITFLNRYVPGQFEIIDDLAPKINNRNMFRRLLIKNKPQQYKILGSDFEVKDGLLPEIVNKKWKGKLDKAYLKNKRQYARILIKRR